MDTKNNESLEQRRKFVLAFNDTMIRIWRERIIMLAIIDTGQLYRSVRSLKTAADPQYTDITLEQQFITYGLFQNYGTGRETPRGNPGDIGRAKIRKARRWFDKKYYASVMNLRDFLADSLALQYIAITADALDDKKLRASVIQSS